MTIWHMEMLQMASRLYMRKADSRRLQRESDLIGLTKHIQLAIFSILNGGDELFFFGCVSLSRLI